MLPTHNTLSYCVANTLYLTVAAATSAVKTIFTFLVNFQSLSFSVGIMNVMPGTRLYVTPLANWLSVVPSLCGFSMRALVCMFFTTCLWFWLFLYIFVRLPAGYLFSCIHSLPTHFAAVLQPTTTPPHMNA